MTDTQHTEHVKREKTNGDALTVSGLSALFTQWLTDMGKFLEERDRRYAELSNAESKRIDSNMAAEAKRVDALLTAAAKNVELANASAESRAAALAERVDVSAKALAERVDTSAKALALQVEATAKAAAERVDATTKTLGDRIAPLEQARYENAGRNRISVPLLMTLSTVGGGVLLFTFEKLAK